MNIVCPSGIRAQNRCRPQKLARPARPRCLQGRCRAQQSENRAHSSDAAQETISSESQGAASVSGLAEDAVQLSRRLLLKSGAITAGGIVCPSSSAAFTTLQDKNGKDFGVYEVAFNLNIVALQSSVTPETILEFQSLYKKYAGLKIGFRNSMQDIYKELSAGPTAEDLDPAAKPKPATAATADLISLGDQWLGPCIQQGLVRPFADARTFRYWESLGPAFQQLVQRQPSGHAATGSAAGKAPVWAVPYRWGCTLVAMRNDKFRERGVKPIHDWHDLLQPRLRGRVAFMNSTRDFVGVALKSLGLRYNATLEDMARCSVSEDMLRERVAAFRAQVRLFSDEQHLAALYGGDVWLAVGSSADVMRVASRSAKIRVVAPQSGTALWADCWAQPAHKRELDASPLIPLWVEQYVQPGRDGPILGLQQGFRPHQLSAPASSRSMCRTDHWESAATEAPPQLDVLSVLSPEVQRGSEFLLPLQDDMKALYARVLQQS